MIAGKFSLVSDFHPWLFQKQETKGSIFGESKHADMLINVVWKANLLLVYHFPFLWVRTCHFAATLKVKARTAGRNSFLKV